MLEHTSVDKNQLEMRAVGEKAKNNPEKFSQQKANLDTLENFDVKKVIPISKKYIFGAPVSFLTAFSQALEDKAELDIDNIFVSDEKSLRIMCNEYYGKNKATVDAWVEQTVNTDNSEKALLTERYDIEGRILCTLLKKEVCLINPTTDEANKIRTIFVLMGENGEQLLTKENAAIKVKNSQTLILLYSPETSHFSPLWRNKKLIVIQKSYRKILKDIILGFFSNILVDSNILLNYFVCSLILKEVGRHEFAATSLIRAEAEAIMLLFSIPLMATSILVAEADKKKMPFESIIRIGQAGAIVAFVLSLPPIILFAVTKPMLLGMSQNATFVEMTQSFFWPYLGGVTLYFLRYNTIMFLSGLNKRLLVAGVDILSLGLAIALTYVFATGKAGLAISGTLGYGAAQSITNVVSFIGYHLVLLFHKKLRRVFRPRGQYLPDIIELLKLGAPIMIAFLGEIGVFFSFSAMAGALGTNQLITQNIYLLYLSLLLVPSISLARTASILVSRALGARKLHDVKRYAVGTTLISMVIPLISIFLFSTLAAQMAKPFVNITDIENENITRTLTIALPLTASGNLFDSLRLVTAGVLLGMQDAAVPALANLGIQLLMVVLMYVLSFHTPLDVSGLVIAYGIGSLILAIGNLVRCKYTFDQITKTTTDQNLEIATLDTIDSHIAKNESNLTRNSSSLWGMDFNFFKKTEKVQNQNMQRTEKFTSHLDFDKEREQSNSPNFLNQVK